MLAVQEFEARVHEGILAGARIVSYLQRPLPELVVKSAAAKMQRTGKPFLLLYKFCHSDRLGTLETSNITSATAKSRRRNSPQVRRLRLWPTQPSSLTELRFNCARSWAR